MIPFESKLISVQTVSKMAAKVLAGFGGFFGYFFYLSNGAELRHKKYVSGLLLNSRFDSDIGL